jgi:hypothetical protein
MPERPERDLPPEALRKLHFHRISLPARIVDEAVLGQKAYLRREAVLGQKAYLRRSPLSCLFEVDLLAGAVLILAKVTHLVTWPWWLVLTPFLILGFPGFVLLLAFFIAWVRSVPCPYCGRPLLSAMAKQCFGCGMDWHDPSNIVCRKKRET